MKKYNISEAAEKLGVPRQTLYYWIKKGWITPRRDYRNYPVFTETDFKNIVKWLSVVKGDKVVNND